MIAVTHMTRNSSVYWARCSASKPGATISTVHGASTNRTPTVTIISSDRGGQDRAREVLGGAGVLTAQPREDGHER